MKKSCFSTCLHFDVCKFKPDPYMGSSSGGFVPSCGYEKYRDDLNEFQAERCKDHLAAILETGGIKNV